MEKNETVESSRLGKLLEEMIESGLVVQNPVELNDFPSARVFVPIYESTSTNINQQSSSGEKIGKLA